MANRASAREPARHPNVGAVLAACAVACLALAPPRAAAQDDRAVYAAGFAAVRSEHEAIARAWYQALERSRPQPAPLVIRLSVPKFLGGMSMDVELVHADGMPREGVAWIDTGALASYPADCSRLSIQGTAGAGTVGGELRVRIPDDMSGAAGAMLDVTVAIKAEVTAQRVAGEFTCRTMAAQTTGRVSGSALTAAAAAAAAPVRGLPALPSAAWRPSQAYRAAAVLEGDACALYRAFRALAAAGGDRAGFTPAFEAGEIPVPVRPAFAAAAPARRPPPPKGKAAPKQPSRAPAKTVRVPDLDGAEPAGDGEMPGEDAPPPPPKATDDDPKSVRERLAPLRAAAAHLAAVRGAMAAALAAAPAPPVQRGLSFDDPLFGPWYGTGTVASADGTVNRLPADAGGAGRQDWPFVHAWTFLGPFILAPAFWDPTYLPDCFETADAGFEGKASRVFWRRAEVLPSGCVNLTDWFGPVEDDEAPDSGGAAQAPARAAVYFCATTIEAARDGEALLAAGCCGHMSVWVNGVLVARGPAHPTASEIDTETLLFRAPLRKGANRLFVRCEPAQYGLFTHRRPGTSSYFWMRVCARGTPGDPAASRQRVQAIAERKRNLPNLPPGVQGFRNDQTGLYADADPVTAWDIDRGINVRWTAAIDRWSKSSPVVVGSRVFTQAEPHVLVCVDAATGKVLWERPSNVLELIDPARFRESEDLYRAYREAKAAAAPKLAELGSNTCARLRSLAAQGVEIPRAVRQLAGMEAEAAKKYGAFFQHLAQNAKVGGMPWDGHFSGNWIGYTFATPVTDGARVYAKFGTGVVACYDLDGKRIWMARTPYAVVGIGVCSSPVLADGKVIIAQEAGADATKSTHGSALKVTALDAANGNVVWTAPAWGDGRPTGTPVVVRLTDGKTDMTVVFTGGGTVLRADDGKVLVNALRGAGGSASPVVVGDVVYRLGTMLAGGVRLQMLDRDCVGARWEWCVSAKFHSSYGGYSYHDGYFFGLQGGGSQGLGGRGYIMIRAANGEVYDRPFDLKPGRAGIFALGRYGFSPAVFSPRHVYLCVRGNGHASSLQEELPNKWQPWTYVTVAQMGPLGRFVAHNKVLAPVTGHPALAGDCVYVRSDDELTCFGHTGDEGRAYEAEVNASVLLQDLAVGPPADAAGAAVWRDGLALCRPYLERVVKLRPGSETAARAAAFLKDGAKP